MARHPSERDLGLWLDGQATEFDEHLSTCAICADRLGVMDTPAGDLRAPLLAALEPDASSVTRVSARVAARLQARRDLDMVASMLGIGIETGRVVFDPISDDD